MTRLVSDELISVFAAAHVADGKIYTLLVAASSDLRGFISDLEAVGVEGAFVDAAEVPRLVLPVAAVVPSVTDLSQVIGYDR